MNIMKDFPSRFVVAIDGPAGSGKSTLAKELAQYLKGIYIDTGAMYRSVTALVLDEGVSPSDEKSVGQVAESISIAFKRTTEKQHVFVNGADFTSRIREKDINENVSIVAAQKKVRDCMVGLQRRLGKGGRVVMEGRDIGTNVFPEARFKFYLVASDEIRAERRVKEMKESGIMASHEGVLQNIRERDRLDSTRDNAPLIKAEGAIEIDTSFMSIDEALQKMIHNIVF
ncbi:Cytidylate kinase [hydrothermal vent metagenome]|uniref:(d)CMP kinase n=1 Tax=hydrothermal vent metagenome TaxID=652676 RepID=A0A3B1BDP2_9ZZZZ